MIGAAVGGLVGGFAGSSVGGWVGNELVEYRLIDLERLDVAGHLGGRRLAHHVTPGGVPVTLEQWFTVVSDLGCTLTGTVSTARYAVAALVFPELARTLEVGGRDG